MTINIPDLYYIRNPDGTFTRTICPSICTVCGSKEKVQFHHWAPRFLFKDADDWPQSPLCIKCHRRWHDTVSMAFGHDKARPSAPPGPQAE